jgi:hypothetical protein
MWTASLEALSAAPERCLTVYVRGLLLVLLVTVIGGCGYTSFDDDEPPPPPTSAELSRFVAETRQPAYWLGPRFRGLGVSYARVERWGVNITYGPWSCDSGCGDEGGVSTVRRSVADDLTVDDYAWPIDPKKCWTRVGKAVAVLIDCDPGGYPQELLVFSGTNEIAVTSLAKPDIEIPARAVVRGLRPLNDAAAWPLPRPAPLSCREFDRVDRRYRRHMPQPLRPVGGC